MFSTNYNPFANQDIFAGPALHGALSRYSKSQGADDASSISSGTAPFKRMIDGWLLAAAIGAGDDGPLQELDERRSTRFITGSVLQGNLGAIEFLMTLAISVSGDPYVVDDPKRIIRIAQQCAERGYPRLEDWMNDGFLSATENLARSIISTVAD